MFGWLKRSLSGASTVSSPEPWLSNLLGGANAGFGDAGQRVTPISATKITTVRRCIEIISNAMAMLPLEVYQEKFLADGNIEQKYAAKHPLTRVLTKRPNRFQSPFVFKQQMAQHLLRYGNAYAEIVRNKRGDIVELIPIRPDNMTVYRHADASISYQYQLWPGDSLKHGTSLDVWHWRWGTLDGYVGISPLLEAAGAIGIALAAEKFSAKFFTNSVTPSGVLAVKGELSPEAAMRLRNQWQQTMAGGDAAHKMAVIGNGAEYQKISFSAVESQIIEARQFQVEDICRIYGVPPHMVGAVSKTSSWGSGVEQQTLGFRKFTLMPYLALVVSEGDTVLLNENAKGFMLRWDTSEYDRGDLAAQAKFYKDMYDIKVLNPNEIRGAIGKNPRPGGNEYSSGQTTASSAEPENAGDSSDRSPAEDPAEGSGGGSD